MGEMTREEMIARHDELVDQYNGLGDDPEGKGDAMLTAMAILEQHLLVTGPVMSDEAFEAMMRGDG